MCYATATTNLRNDAVVRVPLTVSQIRLLEAAIFDRGIMSSGDVHDGRKTRSEHGQLLTALRQVGDAFDAAVRSEGRKVSA